MKNMRKTSQWISILLAGLVIGLSLGKFGSNFLLLFLGLAGFLLVIYLLQHVETLVYLSIASIVIGQFGRIPPGGDANGSLLLIDILVGLTLLAWIIRLVATKSKQQIKELVFLSPAHFLWLCFLAVALILLLANPLNLDKSSLLKNGLYWIRLASYTSFIWIIPDVFQTKTKIEKLFRWILNSGLAIVLLGLIQLYIFPNIGPLAKYGWDPHVGRLVSTFLDPNYLGGFMAIILAMLIAPTVIEKKRFPWIMILLTLLAGLLTYSRSGYLALGLVVLIIGIRYFWKLMLILLIFVVPIGLSIPRVGQRIIGGLTIDQTAKDRIQSWENALMVAKTYPVLGVGYNSYQDAQRQLGIINYNNHSKAIAGSDSSLLNVLATTGIVGIFLAVGALLFIYKKSIQMINQNTANLQTSVALTIAVSLPALFVNSFFVNSFFYPFILLLIASLGGLLYTKIKTIKL
jgi:O-antigen ligase